MNIECQTCMYATSLRHTYPCSKCINCSQWIYWNDAKHIVLGGNSISEGHSSDKINHPSHYTQGKIECIEAIKAMLTADEFRGYLKGTVVKYLWRERGKGQLESIEKAEWFIDTLIKEMKGEL